MENSVCLQSHWCMRGWLIQSQRGTLASMVPRELNPACTKLWHSRDSSEDFLHKKTRGIQIEKVQQMESTWFTRAEIATNWLTQSNWPNGCASHTPLAKQHLTLKSKNLHHSPFNTCVTSASSFRNWQSEEFSSFSVSSPSSDETQSASCWDSSASSSKNCLAAF